MKNESVKQNIYQRKNLWKQDEEVVRDEKTKNRG